MIAGLKPYPAMKDSGVPWLGEVPAHWECAESGNSLRRRNRTGPPRPADCFQSTLRGA